MYSSFTNYLSSCLGHVVSDEDDQTAVVAASNPVATDATNENEPHTDTTPTGSSSTPTIVKDIYAAAYEKRISSVPSDGCSREVGNILVVEKAVESSPSRSVMDKTVVSSDEYESSEGDEEAQGFIRPLDVENKRRLKKMLICCFAVLMIVI